MKTIFRFPLVAFATVFLFVSILAQAQKATPAKSPRYKDVVVDNPNAERDMKVAGDFVNALVSGNQKKARSLVSSTFMGHGPAPSDSSNIDKTLKEWAANYKTQLNRKVGFVTTTWLVKSGNYKGTWVSLWGEYSFTQAGKPFRFPFNTPPGLTTARL
jgi:hypothetical protein